MSHQVQVTMTFERSTPHTVRYMADDDTAPIKTLYVKKDAFGQTNTAGSWPRRLVLTVQAADS